MGKHKCLCKKMHDTQRTSILWNSSLDSFACFLRGQLYVHVYFNSNIVMAMITRTETIFPIHLYGNIAWESLTGFQSQSKVYNNTPSSKITYSLMLLDKQWWFLFCFVFVCVCVCLFVYVCCYCSLFCFFLYIIECFGMKGALNITSSHPPCHGQGHLILDQVS